MTDYIVNSQLVLYSLFAIVVGSIIWHFIENRWDARIFEKDKKGIFKNIHAKAALFAFDHVEGFVPVDVRSEHKFLEGHIPGAINAPWHDNKINSSALEALDPNTPILLYCEGGFASRRAINSVKDLGFHTIYHLHRGFKSWQFFGGAVEGNSETRERAPS